MRSITVQISDTAHRRLKEAAEREGTTPAALAGRALEQAAYAAALAKCTPKDDGPFHESA
ncbi:hypothetical protein [Glycomyces salinus]|uniref:hypothetical protein n=1 Tax=Glycomyces salinus TaxID=980294 RepID=UPI0018EA67C7|nr:hypothetical protein [Glycomyces salinus]